MPPLIPITMRFIEIKDKRYYVSFNMAAFLEVEKFTGMPFSTLFENIESDPSIMFRLNYLGLKYGADEAGKRFDLTYSAFIALVTENQEVILDLSNMVAEDFKTLIELQNEKMKLYEKDGEGSKKKKASGRTTSA